jgi:hypothetical protein
MCGEFLHQSDQGWHRMKYGDSLALECLCDAIGIGDKFRWGQPERGSHQKGDPDLLKRHVERHREALIHSVLHPDAKNGVFAAQKMADISVGDRDAFWGARGA